MELFIVTSNGHKVEEFKKILNPLGYNIKSLLDINEDIEIIENGKTYEENSLIKAKTINDIYNIPCIADDSGFEVDFLNKEPGIYSARYLGENTSQIEKNNSILKRMENISDRTCRFVCVITYIDNNKEVHVFKGIIEGEVAREINGENGFGYDPIFFYPPFKNTLANIPPQTKNEISHRGQAVRKLVEYLEK